MSLEYFHDYNRDIAQQASDLFGLVEMGQRDPDRMFAALESSFIVVRCMEGDKLVGIGRCISDGIFYSSIFDVAVNPEYQGRGVGREIMTQIQEKIVTPCVYLTSTFGKEHFYKKLGFKKHKTALAKYKKEQSEYLEEIL